MASLPPGFVLEAPRDPWEILRAEGFTATNGFRTEGDVERIRRQGYTPASNGAHNRGDGVDLDHPRLSPAQQERRLRELFGDWDGMVVLNEGHHRHLALPGWRAAPGTPGTPNSGLPPLPEGFELEQRGPISPDNFFEAPPAPPAPVAAPAQTQAPAPLPTTANAGEGVAMSEAEQAAMAAALDELETAFDNGASRAELLRIAGQRGVLRATPTFPRALDAALAWREANPGSARGVNTFRPGDVTAGPGISEHRPDIAERIGNVVGSVIEPVVGDRTARDTGSNLSSLLDWTGVGDFDAANQFRTAEQRALLEGRPLDAAGNNLGAQISAAGLIPIVGPAIGRVRRALNGGTEAVQAAPSLGDLLPNARVRDYIDVRNPRTLDEPQIGRTTRAPSPQEPNPITPERVRSRTALEATQQPAPSTRVETPEEAARANPSTFEEVQPPNDVDELQMRTLRHPRTGAEVRHRGPLDAEQFLRSRGGIREEAGELRHTGITNNAPRPEFRSEARLGRLINNEDGMTLDEAGLLLYEHRFLDHRPTTAEVIDILRESRLGQRLYRMEDAEELARFEAARAARHQVEEARRDGTPIVERVGDTADLADLDDNQPPATAYEDLAKPNARVANINLSNLQTTQDIRRALEAGEMSGGMNAARRGTISNTETSALANELGMTADDLLKRRRGQALNAEQALAARQILARSLDEITALAAKVEGGSEEELAAFRQAWVRHVAIQEQVTGATAEAGRALQSFRMMARSQDHKRRVLQAFIQNGGGQDNLENVARGVLDAVRVMDPTRANRFLFDANKPTWKDKLVELWYNSLLSGPKTHAVNILSNAMTAALQIPEHAAAAVFGKLRWRSFDRVMGSEVGARAVGLMQGTREGMRAFAHTLKTGDIPDFVQKVETARQEAIGGVAGKAIRIPTRMLSAEDEFFKATARRMELAGLAVRRARSEGLKGEALARRIEELNANPTEEMLNKAMEYGRYLTFQRDVGDIAGGLMRITQNHPYLKLIVPFIRTPTNLVKFAAERSPLSPLVRAWREDFMAGGARRDLAVAKSMLGTGLGVTVGYLAAEGLISGGGPADQNQARLLRADGWQPYSIKIGDTYYSYQRLDPMSTTIGVVADMIDLQSAMTERQQEQVPMLIVASILENLSGKTWLSGVADFLQIFEDPQRYGPQFIQRTAASIAVPSIVNQAGQAIDPHLREAKSIMDAIRARVPGLSDNLPTRRDVFGRPIIREGGLGPDAITPIYTQERRNDPVVNEMRLIGASIGYPSRRVGGGTLPPEVYEQYQELAGRYTYNDLVEAMSDPEWALLDVEDRRREANSIKNRARRDAREELFGMEE